MVLAVQPEKRMALTFYLHSTFRYLILSFHCFRHPQVLCAKTAFKLLQKFVNVVTKLVNLISVRALNKQKIPLLLSNMDLMHGGLLMYNNL